MLSLEDGRWRELHHANGHAENIPELLRRLGAAADDIEFSDILTEIMSYVWHQCDYCEAGLAVAPHFLAIGSESSPGRCSHLLASIALIEIARQSYLTISDTDDMPADLVREHYTTVQAIRTMIASDKFRNCGLDTKMRCDGVALVASGDWRLGWERIVAASQENRR